MIRKRAASVDENNNNNSNKRQYLEPTPFIGDLTITALATVIQHITTDNGWNMDNWQLAVSLQRIARTCKSLYLIAPLNRGEFAELKQEYYYHQFHSISCTGREFKSIIDLHALRDRLLMQKRKERVWNKIYSYISTLSPERNIGILHDTLTTSFFCEESIAGSSTIGFTCASFNLSKCMCTYTYGQLPTTSEYSLLEFAITNAVIRYYTDASMIRREDIVRLFEETNKYDIRCPDEESPLTIQVLCLLITLLSVDNPAGCCCVPGEPNRVRNLEIWLFALLDFLNKRTAPLFGAKWLRVMALVSMIAISVGDKGSIVPLSDFMFSYSTKTNYYSSDDSDKEGEEDEYRYDATMKVFGKTLRGYFITLSKGVEKITVFTFGSVPILKNSIRDYSDLIQMALMWHCLPLQWRDEHESIVTIIHVISKVCEERFKNSNACYPIYQSIFDILFSVWRYKHPNSLYICNHRFPNCTLSKSQFWAWAGIESNIPSDQEYLEDEEIWNTLFSISDNTPPLVPYAKISIKEFQYRVRDRVMLDKANGTIVDYDL